MKPFVNKTRPDMIIARMNLPLQCPSKYPPLPITPATPYPVFKLLANPIDAETEKSHQDRFSIPFTHTLHQ